VGIDPYSGQPAYLQIAGLLRAQIESGEIPVGSFLPSLTTISQRYEVARMTAERAVGQLRAAGLVRGVPGRGVIVLPEAERGGGPS
jgi:DNA-binding GntR family transcriptional regulator